MATEQLKKTGLGTLGVVTSGLRKNKRMLEHNSIYLGRAGEGTVADSLGLPSALCPFLLEEPGAR